MSLSSWFRDYLYIPLGGSRVPKWRWYVNLMVVFALSGLWHGASWTFVIWGGLHGLYYLLEIWTQGIRDRAAGVLHLDKPAIRRALGIAVTLNLVCLGWVFFRANSISDAFLLFTNMVHIRASTDVLAPWAGSVGRPGIEMAFALGLIALLTVEHVLGEQGRQAPLRWGQQGWVRWVAYLLLALSILNLGVSREIPFVYLEF